MELKKAYFVKKEILVNKLDIHQEKVERIYQIYYETLNQLRNDHLKQEYKLRAEMKAMEDGFVKLIK